jgi:hypothetical protein
LRATETVARERREEERGGWRGEERERRGRGRERRRRRRKRGRRRTGMVEGPRRGRP